MKKAQSKTNVWTFCIKTHPKSSVQVGTDGERWFAELPVNPLIYLFEGLAMMAEKNGKPPILVQWDGSDGARARCADCLDAKVVAVVDRLVEICKREYAANPNNEHGPIEYDSIWSD